MTDQPSQEVASPTFSFSLRPALSLPCLGTASLWYCGSEEMTEVSGWTSAPKDDGSLGAREMTGLTKWLLHKHEEDPGSNPQPPCQTPSAVVAAL